jgi:predicted dehydrogenase
MPGLCFIAAAPNEIDKEEIEAAQRTPVTGGGRKMNLTAQMRRIGRRNFLKAVGGLAAFAGLGTTAVFRGPRRGGPVRLALIGFGAQGKVLANLLDPQVAELVAVCEIRPLSQPDSVQTSAVKWYQDWRRMLHEQRIEGVLIATPPSAHAEIATACLAAGKHVFCETPMATDAADCQRMIKTAKTNKRILQVGYQEYYSPHYRAAYRNLLQNELLGEVYTVEAAWHNSSSGRKEVAATGVTFDPRPWGYASLDELVNWRLYRRYSNGLTSEWGGALISLTNWFLDSSPTSVQATGGIFSYKDGRENADHVYASLEYPGGKTATLSLVQSNGFEGGYVQFMGTKGTLIIGRDDALLFTESVARPTTVSAANVTSGQPILDTSASRSAEAANHSTLTQGTVGVSDEEEAIRQEIAGFCGAIRTGAPLRCEPASAYNVALACEVIDQAMERAQRLPLPSMADSSQRGGLRVVNGWFENA